MELRFVSGDISCLAEFNPCEQERSKDLFLKIIIVDIGGVTQPDRVVGSYPICRRFKSSRRHQFFIKNGGRNEKERHPIIRIWYLGGNIRLYL